MISPDDHEKYKTCCQLLDEGKYKDAVSIADSISYPAFKAAILVDGGFAIGRSGKVREGTGIFDNLVLSDTSDQEFSRASLLYNAANAHSSLYELRVRRRKKAEPTNDDDLRAAKKLYREALSSIKEEPGAFESQIWVNYGNCLSRLGRFVEAIESYEKAMIADPTNGMAAGNLAMGLEYAARLTGHYRHEYLALAHELLLRAFGSEMHLRYGSKQAVEAFKSLLDGLQEFINAHKKPVLPPKPVNLEKEKKVIKGYTSFCIDNGLFLSPWVGNRALSPGVTDNISFGSIITESGTRSKVPELLHILNEIKESFSTARYLLFLSQQQCVTIDSVSKMTIYYGNNSYEIKGLYTGLCKTAYARAFDILDKVARIVNVYFGIGDKLAPFWSIFAEKQSLGEDHLIRYGAKRSICENENAGLFALADLCIDYFESEHVDFKTYDVRRNRITHDYLNVELYVLEEEMKENSSNIGLDELSAQTKKVLILAKYAILYVVSAISISENKKRENAGRLYSIEYSDTPGQSFL